MTDTNVRSIGVIGIEADQISIPFSNRPLLWGIILTILISVFLRISAIFSLGDILYEAEVDSILLYSIVFGAQFIMGFVLVVILLPILMSDRTLLSTIRSRVQPSRDTVTFGAISGAIFLLVAAVISILMGIFNLDWSVLFGTPDVYVDPDVVGWFYFLLALVPAVWEEIVFRGIILYQLKNRYSDNRAILISSLLFSLYHFSVILSRPIDAVIGGVVMSFFYGLAWGSLVLKFDSVLPAIISHYIIDTFGILFLYADVEDPLLFTQYMILITILYPIIHWLIFRYARENIKTGEP